MIQTLTELTKGEIFGDLERFKKTFGDVAAEKLSENIKNFSFWDNGQNVLIYDGMKIVLDCNYTEFKGKKHLTSCYCNTGLAFDFEE